jgi:chaperonin GroEL
MSVKEFAFAAAARGEAMRGVDILGRAVQTTLGPKGRTVALGREFGVKITKDGVSVAREVELEEQFQNAAVKLVRAAALRTSQLAGDGTTTAVVLTSAIARGCGRAMASGLNPMDLRRGLDRAVAAVTAELARNARPVATGRRIAQVAAISANGDAAIGDLVAAAMEQVGADGVITIEEGATLATALEVARGVRFDRSYVSPHFITDRMKRLVEMEDAYLLLSDRKLDSIDALMPLLEQAHAAEKPLLIVAEDYEGEVKAALAVNRLRAGLKVAAVKAPAYGALRQAMMDDIALMTGGVLFSESLGLRLQDMSLAQLGRARKVTIDPVNTTIAGGLGDQAAIDARVALLRSQIGETSSTDDASDYDRDTLRGRLARLSGGVALIRVGAGGEAEMREKIDRIRNAVNATRAAAEEGVLPGGGVALLRAAEAIRGLRTDNDGQNVGIAILREAISWPARQIALNAGEEPAMVISRILAVADHGHGYDARTGSYGDMLEMGILDPAKVVRTALQSAASIAGLLMTTEAIIAEPPGPPPPEMPGHDHHDHRDLDIDW